MYSVTQRTTGVQQVSAPCCPYCLGQERVKQPVLYGRNSVRRAAASVCHLVYGGCTSVGIDQVTRL